MYRLGKYKTNSTNMVATPSTQRILSAPSAKPTTYI